MITSLISQVMDETYDAANFIYKGLEGQNLRASSKLQPCFLKKPLYVTKTDNF